jgi:ribosome-associated protein
MLYINRKISIPRSELSFTFARSPGPGGQNVNKVNSKAILRWEIEASQCLPMGVKQRFVAKFKNRISNEGVLVLSSHRYRDQPRNIEDCLDKLIALLLSVAEPPKPRKKKKLSAGAKRRRLENKRRKSEKKRLRGPLKE